MPGGVAPGKDAWKDQATGQGRARQLDSADKILKPDVNHYCCNARNAFRKNCLQFVWEDQGVRHNLILTQLN